MDDIRWKLDQLGMRQLEVFYQVAETGSFSEAARELGLQQPTVSNHVQQIEDMMDEPLLLRESSGIRLTRLGELFYRKLQSVQAARDDLQQALLDYFQSREGTLHLGASTIPGEVLLPRLMPHFHDQYPGIELALEVGDSRDIGDKIRKGELRYGVVGTQFNDDPLESRTLFVDDMVLVGAPSFAPDKPLAIDDLPDLPYVDRLPGSGTRESVEQFLQEHDHEPGETLNRVAQLETVQAVREALVNGLGVSFLPLSVVAPDLERGDLTALDGQFETVKRRFFGIHNQFLGRSPFIEQFEEVLLNTWRDVSL